MRNETNDNIKKKAGYAHAGAAGRFSLTKQLDVRYEERKALSPGNAPMIGRDSVRKTALQASQIYNAVVLCTYSNCGWRFKNFIHHLVGASLKQN
jgi:hypothetical protein